MLFLLRRLTFTSIYIFYYKTLLCKCFIQGSVTCHGKTIKSANCPKHQYMVTKTASYRGLPDTKTCGLSDDNYRYR